jgi:hypothetical protein
VQFPNNQFGVATFIDTWHTYKQNTKHVCILLYGLRNSNLAIQKLNHMAFSENVKFVLHRQALFLISSKAFSNPKWMES